MDEIKELKFVNELNGVAHNLIKWLKAQLKHDEFITNAKTIIRIRNRI